MEDITHVTAKGSSRFTLTNTNKLLRSYDGCDGLKTGSTSFAKYCLSATARRDGIRLISVVMTAPDSKTRFAEAGKLLNYGFSRCSLYYDGEMPALSPITVRGAVEETVDVGYPDEFSYLSTSGEDFSGIERSIEWGECRSTVCCRDAGGDDYLHAWRKEDRTDADRDKDRSPKSRVFHLADAEPGTAVHIVEIDPNIQIWYNGKMAV